MKTLIAILVLFSTSLLADVFNCEVTQQSKNFGDATYDVLVDTGSEDLSVLTLSDVQTGEFKELISEVYSVGKIYFNKGNPYSTEKIDADIYFTRSGSESHYGIFFIDRFPKTITLELWHKEENKIFITDTESMFGHLQIGKCK